MKRTALMFLMSTLALVPAGAYAREASFEELLDGGSIIRVKAVELPSLDTAFTVQADKDAAESRTSAADTASAREILAIARRADSPFGTVSGGNLGLSAYRLTPEAANLTVAFVKRTFPGIPLGNRKYSASGPQMVLVITSDDEPYVHMYDQAPSSGKLTRIDDFNSTQESDLPTLLNKLAGKDRAIALPLGAGSASPFWWAD